MDSTNLSCIFSTLARERERERERERGRGKEGGREVVSHMWKKSIAVHTQVWSAPGIIVALSDLMEDMQA